MAATAKRTDPALWETVKAQVTAGDKGGEKGQWSARKAQLAVQEYKKAGGFYAGRKAPDNHLRQWTEEKWSTASGDRSRDSGERYLPEAARQALTEEEYAATTRKKRADTKAGKQFSGQPKAIATKTARAKAAGRPAKPPAPTRKAPES